MPKPRRLYVCVNGYLTESLVEPLLVLAIVVGGLRLMLFGRSVKK